MPKENGGVDSEIPENQNDSLEEDTSSFHSSFRDGEEEHEEIDLGK